jgi:hypothetical protein
MKALLAFSVLALPAAAQSQVVDVSQPGQGFTPAGGPNTMLGASGAGSDDFNRPDAADLGAPWTERLGDHRLVNGQGTGTPGFITHWSTYGGASAGYVGSVMEVDFFNQPDGGTEVVFVACTFGDATNSSQQIFVKVQDNTQDGTFDRVFFYLGINGSAWTNTTGNTFPLATVCTQGRMRVSFSPDGDIAICEIDNNSDGVYDEQFQCDGLLGAGSFGTDVGVSSFGDGAFDNWSLNGGASNSGSAYCFGDGSGTLCPCAALGGAGEGCLTTSGTGATLAGSGNADVGSDSLVLTVTGGPANKPGIFFQGNSQLNGGNGNPAGDGILCTAGGTIRYSVNPLDASGSTSQSGFGVNAGAGLTRNYQYWFRDTGNPCGGQFNFTNAWSVTWN